MHARRRTRCLCQFNEKGCMKEKKRRVYSSNVTDWAAPFDCSICVCCAPHLKTGLDEAHASGLLKWNHRRIILFGFDRETSHTSDQTEKRPSRIEHRPAMREYFSSYISIRLHRRPNSHFNRTNRCEYLRFIYSGFIPYWIILFLIG